LKALEKRGLIQRRPVFTEGGKNLPNKIIYIGPYPRENVLKLGNPDTYNKFELGGEYDEWRMYNG
jgi:hypothetical protein